MPSLPTNALFPPAPSRPPHICPTLQFFISKPLLPFTVTFRQVSSAKVPRGRNVRVLKGRTDGTSFPQWHGRDTWQWKARWRHWSRCLAHSIDNNDKNKISIVHCVCLVIGIATTSPFPNLHWLPTHSQQSNSSNFWGGYRNLKSTFPPHWNNNCRSTDSQILQGPQQSPPKGMILHTGKPGTREECKTYPGPHTWRGPCQDQSSASNSLGH
jgi:hypothetical protein